MILFELEDARIFSILLKNILDVIGVYEEAEFKAEPNGIIARQMDSSKVVMYEMFLPTNFFEEYYGATLDKPIIFRFNAKRVFDFLKGLTEPLVFEINKAEKRLKITVEDIEFEIAYIPGEEILPELKLTPAASVTFKTDLVLPIVGHFNDSQVVVKIKISYEGFTMEMKEEYRHFQRSEFKIPKNMLISMNINKEAESFYNGDLLKLVLGKKELSSTSTVSLIGEKRYVLRVEYPLAGIDKKQAGFFRYYVAPRTSE
jgi:DNA polymerase III sliding clamp (beta) subunit (PCNA family)